MTEVRFGVTLPLPGIPLREHRRIVSGLADAGYGDVWTAEGGGVDAFTPLAATAAWDPRLRLASAIVPVHTRGPAVLAQTAATLADLTAGGLVLGIGSSVPAHVTDLNGIPFDDPFRRTRDTLRFLTRALRGEVVSGAFDTFTVRGFALPEPPAETPKVILGALRPGMLRLGFTEGDGAVTNILSAEDLATVRATVGPQPAGKELVVKVFVSPTADAEAARHASRPFLTWILNQTPYHSFHEWLGNGDRLAASHERWLAGDQRGAAEALPDDVIDRLFIHGTPQQCRDQIAEYVQPGVTAVQLYVRLEPSFVLASAQTGTGGVRTWRSEEFAERALDLLRTLRPRIATPAGIG
ncbi:LLM class F420-dependent oxidoreductase [Frankia sp. QA3]|uniref:LLM class F420-dependent oxidoreductase n=1 Tax=Frankia sp. QA3 TaxID=710111 RepID=UPI000269BB80|nr:LLM class F420-dependent oxidoreductase [Frankia sp. QA3]EIV91259.1 putative F420-dependent oxidoreductase, Rv3093c family [Frankia sp. QA3]